MVEPSPFTAPQISPLVGRIERYERCMVSFRRGLAESCSLISGQTLTACNHIQNNKLVLQQRVFA